MAVTSLYVSLHFGTDDEGELITEHLVFLDFAHDDEAFNVAQHLDAISAIADDLQKNHEIVISKAKDLNGSVKLTIENFDLKQDVYDVVEELTDEIQCILEEDGFVMVVEGQQTKDIRVSYASSIQPRMLH